MPGEQPVGDVSSAPFRWWFLPSWLGLDAPCVVLTWTWAASRALDVELPVRSAVAMFLVVWCIYLADRLVDIARCQDWTKATGRLRFGRDRQLWFWICLAFCGAGLAGIPWAGLSVEVLQRGAIVALGVSLHCLAFVTPMVLRVKLRGKEFGVGLFFALGAYVCLGATWRALPLLVSIGIVVAFNCLVIAARDADSDEASDDGAASRWWRTLNRDLYWLGAAFTVAAIVCSVVAVEAMFYLSLATAFALLTALHSRAPKLSGDAVRALADFALLTPIPLELLGSFWTAR